ncbi:sugar transferase [Planomonospora algeriensis]
MFLSDLSAIIVACALEMVRAFLLVAHVVTVEKILVGLALCVLWPAAIAGARGYEQRFAGVGPEEFRRVFQAAALLIAVVATVAYAAQTPYARGYVLFALPLAAVLTLLGRYAMRKRLHRWHAQGRFVHRVVAVGHRESVLTLINQFRLERHHGMAVVAACLPTAPGRPMRSEIAGVPVSGDFASIPEVVRAHRADTVAVLACPEMDGTALRRLSWRLEESGTQLYVASALMEVAGPRTTIRPVAGLPLLHVDHPELSGVRQFFKDAFDRVVAAAVLLLLSPVMLTVAAAIRFGDPGPALFRQTRVGRGGREFQIYKFRTMVTDAEKIKSSLVAWNEKDGVLFKMRHDPRVTRVGALLRKHSVDELPQLLNVLRGEMSLVGPRPPLPEEVAQYGDDVRRRLVVKPGMTGLWQVSGRSDLTWEESVRLDLRYVENWSLALDLQILWKTWPAISRGRGAY